MTTEDSSGPGRGVIIGRIVWVLLSVGFGFGALGLLEWGARAELGLPLEGCERP